MDDEETFINPLSGGPSSTDQSSELHSALVQACAAVAMCRYLLLTTDESEHRVILPLLDALREEVARLPGPLARKTLGFRPRKARKK